MNMYNWVDQQIYDRNKKAFPILTYPSVQMLLITVKELVESSAQMAMGMRLIADRYKMPAALSYMDLSVEAEAFGANAVYKADEVPTIIGRLIASPADADKLVVPSVGAGRTGICVEAIGKALRLINDRPVIANCAGPFSLAGRLMNVNDILLQCLEEPEFVHVVLRKATEFIINYINEFKRIGANGVILAEPLAGLLSPTLMQEFSTDYVKQIVAATQEKNFIIIYHNCANGTEKLIPEILDTGCKVFHFGDKVNMLNIIKSMPARHLILGNISASSIFKSDSLHHIRMSTQRLLLECMDYKNFMVSSGCDIPADTDLDNIDEFFRTVESGYYKRMLWDTIM